MQVIVTTRPRDQFRRDKRERDRTGNGKMAVCMMNPMNEGCGIRAQAAGLRY